MPDLPNLPDEVCTFLVQFSAALTSRCPTWVQGLYLRGSLVTGDFRLASSDIDLLALTAHPVTAAEFATLDALHTEVAGWPHPFACRFEISYLDAAALRVFTPGQRFPTLGQSETLVWTEHGSNWILERWMVREVGVALFGPPPAALIDPIAPEALMAAVRARLADWEAWAHALDDPDWQLHRGHKFYVVETICRALHTLATGRLASKVAAMTWARTTFPPPWRDLVEAAQAWENDPTRDATLIPPVRAFVLWACARAQD
jgi:hypothetical protein